ncbi:MerR family transcriptional regulator [Nocardia spumae]|uniref:MerR family transcriptional regulator n=1 Tax=Nocardia spumae TaxID=2887190 RepID=UPI0027DF932F|nr:MerR family transcriptional regulator [Nocardia spumae]
MTVMPTDPAPEIESAGFPIGTVAERIGIPTATLRSWNQRYGIGPTGHRPGRHRLYTEADIAVLERMVLLVRAGASPARAASSVRGPAPAEGDCSSLLAAVFALDSATASALLMSHLRTFGVVSTWNRLCRPTFAEIVRRQGSGEGCIDVEHLLSWCVTSALHRVVPPPPASAVADIVLACTSGEAHALPLEVLRAALAERGAPANMLGPDVPTHALADTLTRTSAPTTVVLWSHHESTALTSAVRTCTEGGAHPVLAGPGWADAALPADAVTVDDLESALAHLLPIGAR